MEDDFLEMQYEDQHGYPEMDFDDISDSYCVECGCYYSICTCSDEPEPELIRQCFNCDAPTSNLYCSICIHSEGVY